MTLSVNTYAVTGASGKLGRLVIEELSKQVNNEQIVGIVRDPAKVADLKSQGIQIRQADYNDQPALFQALKGIDTVLLISGTAIGQRIEQHQNVVDAALKNGVRKIIYTSFPMRFPPNSPLVNDHAQTEEYIKNCGMEYIIIRNTFYAEVMLENVNLIVNKGEFLTIEGDGGVPYISRADIAAAATNLMLSDKMNNQIFELTGPEVINYRKLVELIRQTTHQDIRLVQLSDQELIRTLHQQGVPEPAIQGRLGFEKMIVSRALEHVSSDFTKIVGAEPTSFGSLLDQFIHT